MQVCFIWIAGFFLVIFDGTLGETLNYAFMFIATLHSFLDPAIVQAQSHIDSCRHWLVAFSLQIKSLSIPSIHIGVGRCVGFIMHTISRS